MAASIGALANTGTSPDNLAAIASTILGTVTGAVIGVSLAVSLIREYRTEPLRTPAEPAATAIITTLTRVPPEQSRSQPPGSMEQNGKPGDGDATGGERTSPEETPEGNSAPDTGNAIPAEIITGLARGERNLTISAETAPDNRMHQKTSPSSQEPSWARWNGPDNEPEKPHRSRAE